MAALFAAAKRYEQPHAHQHVTGRTDRGASTQWMRLSLEKERKGAGLARSVEHVTPSRSHDFKPRVALGNYFKKKKKEDERKAAQTPAMCYRIPLMRNTENGQTRKDRKADQRPVGEEGIRNGS